MNLQKLGTMDLDLKIKTLAQKERDLLGEVLLTIKEIDSRRTFLELGFGSLFDYLVKGVGYSEGSAQRRIDSARLIREIPEMAAKIQTGEIKLSQVSLVQKASRELVRSQNIKPTTEQKKEILYSLCNKNHSESQHQVASFFELPIQEASKKSIQADESVRIEFTLSKDAFAKIKKAQELLSHAVPDHELSSFLEYLADKVIQQKTGLKKATEARSSTAMMSAGSDDVSTATVAVKLGRTTAVETVSRKSPQAQVIKLLKKEMVCCEYISPLNGQKCRSTWKLQVDHKHSQWAGGGHHKENLQMLCAQHNQLKYRQEAGLKFLS